MRITFVAPAPNLSGGLRVIATHADRLRARGHAVTVVAPRFRPPGLRASLRALAAGRWPVRRAPASHFDTLQADLRLFDPPGPATDADLPDADAVIATWWETAFAVAALSPAKGRKFYLVQGHEVFDGLPVHLSAGSYYLPLHKICISGWLSAIMSDRYGDSDTSLVPNAVDHALFHAPPRDRQPRPTVGFMYAPGRVKGTDIALQALALIARARPDLRVVAFGATPPQRDLPLPPGAGFTLRPAQHRLRELYAACDVWLSASRSEGFGLPILEAMACRCPVVASATGCAADLIEPGRTGDVVPVGDPAALAQAALQVLALDDAGWRAMSQAAHARATGYDWDDAAALLEAVLQRS